MVGTSIPAAVEAVPIPEDFDLDGLMNLVPDLKEMRAQAENKDVKHDHTLKDMEQQLQETLAQVKQERNHLAIARVTTTMNTTMNASRFNPFLATQPNNDIIRPPSPPLTQKILNPKPDPSIPVVIPPAIPNELSGPQTQALLYGYTIDDTTAKALGLSRSYEVCIVLAEELSRLNLEGYYNSYGRSMKDDLQLYYFAIKYPSRGQIWTQNGQGTIPSYELIEQLSATIKSEPRWYGYEDMTTGE
ncbi:hypothetical protein BT96DRAFT_932245 [Gymnopus androsaceus JB14]|uniref:Uncharacterized protein n=1 Tax=Gymnopus androsaceus JB14 TaxID=1447944 RepID=A0A6A4IK84_9AGAR|nr:hypothetical protein BT96DRAFT_932245 [Gymnopus androsaceus JB14]